MSAKKLKTIIENSEKRITKPNDCYNSGVIDCMYKKTSGSQQEYESIQISLCYGKPIQFIFWKNGKEFRQETISTSKIIFEEGVYKTKYYIIKLNN
jgi:hypothetical protein